ncbi:MAG: HEPN domain-containing protein [Cyclobacteriaceae bacterium]
MKRDYIQYRLERFEESMVEAKLLADNSHFNTAINRLYYACFYLADALLTQEEIKHNSHAGTKNQLFQHFGTNGKIERRLLSMYSRLFQARQNSDYGDQLRMTQSDFDEFYPEVIAFQSAVKKLIITE